MSSEIFNLTLKMTYATIAEIQAARDRLSKFIIETPVVAVTSPVVEERIGETSEVFLKLELFQHGGSFKPRGALMVMLNLDHDALAQGVTAVSAGNHAIAVAYAAKVLGISAKVVMTQSANPSRVQRCKDLGAEIVLMPDVHQAFDEVHRIEQEEERAFVHPFEGPMTSLGVATLGYELCNQISDLDAVIVPVGGGGLISGVAMAVKQMQPECKIFGVEPVGADSMTRSLKSGKPESIDKVRTIADSLGAPHAAPYSFSLCQEFVDEVVLVDDDVLRRSMALMFAEAKLAVEPAGAAAMAALCGPLRERLSGKRTGLIVCGANIDFKTFSECIANFV